MNIDISMYRQRIGYFARIGDNNSTVRGTSNGSSKTPSLVFMTFVLTSICLAFVAGLVVHNSNIGLRQSSSISSEWKCSVVLLKIKNLGYEIDHNFLAKYRNGNRNKGGLKIMHWNAGGGFLKHKLPEIESVIAKYKPHLFGISESCFKKDHDLNQIKIDEYEVFLANTLDNVRLNVSRIAVYVHKDLIKRKLRTDLMDEHFSSVWLEVGLKDQKTVLVGNIYRDWQYLNQNDKSSLSVDAQLARFSDFIEKWENAIESSEECHLLGDLNLNFLDFPKSRFLPNSQSYKLQALIKLLFERIFPLGAVQCVTTPTRVSPNNEPSGLDHYYTTNPQKLSPVSVITNGASDHKMICATRFSKNLVSKESMIRKRSYKNFDCENIKILIAKALN